MSLKSRDTFNNTGGFIDAASSSYVGRTTRDTSNDWGMDLAPILPNSPINNLNSTANVTNFQTPEIPMKATIGWQMICNTLPYTIPTTFLLLIIP